MSHAEFAEMQRLLAEAISKIWSSTLIAQRSAAGFDVAITKMTLLRSVEPLDEKEFEIAAKLLETALDTMIQAVQRVTVIIETVEDSRWELADVRSVAHADALDRRRNNGGDA